MTLLFAALLAAPLVSSAQAKDFRFASDPEGARLYVGDSPRGPWRLAIDRMPGTVPMRSLRGKYFKAVRPPNRDSQPIEGNQMLDLEEYLIVLEAPPQSTPPERPRPTEVSKETPAVPEITFGADVPNYVLAQSTMNYALVLAVEDYKALPKASHALRDANAIRAHLRALGYPDRNIISLLGPDASKSGIEKYLSSWLPKNLRVGASLFVYYSGHGAPDPTSGDSYLVPWDGDVSFLKDTAISLSSLYESLAALPITKAMVLIDSCFSGTGERSVIASGTRPLVIVHEEVPKAGAIATISAAAGDEIAGSDPSGTHGLLTANFLSALNDRRGKGTFREYFEYISPRVQDAARTANRAQSPQYHSTVPTEFALGRY